MHFIGDPPSLGLTRQVTASSICYPERQASSHSLIIRTQQSRSPHYPRATLHCRISPNYLAELQFPPESALSTLRVLNLSLHLRILCHVFFDTRLSLGLSLILPISVRAVEASYLDRGSFIWPCLFKAGSLERLPCVTQLPWVNGDSVIMPFHSVIAAVFICMNCI